MGDLGVEMAEMVEMEESVVAMSITEAKTRKIKILNNLVVVAAENTTSHKEGGAAEKTNATDGTPQVVPWGVQ